MAPLLDNNAAAAAISLRIRISTNRQNLHSIFAALTMANTSPFSVGRGDQDVWIDGPSSVLINNSILIIHPNGEIRKLLSQQIDVIVLPEHG